MTSCLPHVHPSWTSAFRRRDRRRRERDSGMERKSRPERHAAHGTSPHTGEHAETGDPQRQPETDSASRHGVYLYVSVLGRTRREKKETPNARGYDLPKCTYTPSPSAVRRYRRRCGLGCSRERRGKQNEGKEEHEDEKQEESAERERNERKVWMMRSLTS